ncbi:spike base protein, RCAP_Rcc01079 family [Primorskyibacter sp. 2E107]|uniref:spike base protein, RCAP_Rcc01079 family n=1 Tax=Primorskyibacter sp. 2E107 TaxID=3403458 RepID=UPI003AF8DA94
MTDHFSKFSRSITSPPFGGYAITPDDGADLPTVTRALNVGVPGTVRATLLDGSDVTLHIGAGSLFPMRATRIWATGTTAGNLVGLY